MTDDIAELQELKKELEDSKAEIHVAKGKYESAMEQLGAFGFSSIEEAEKAAEAEAKSLQSRKTELEKEIEDFKNEYSDFFE